MPVEGLITVAVVYLDVYAVAGGVAAGKGHQAVAGGVDGRAGLGRKVHTGVHAPDFAHRMHAHAEADTMVRRTMSMVTGGTAGMELIMSFLRRARSATSSSDLLSA